MKRVEVTWLDATTVLGGPWYNREEVLTKEGREPVCVRSIGFVLHSDKKILMLTGDFHDARVGRPQIILRSSIVKYRRLK